MPDGIGEEQSADADQRGFISRWKADTGGRPEFVYVVVAIVVVTLTILLAVIYFSASERERTSPPICTDIGLDRAEQAILRGDVERLTVVYDETPYTPVDDRYGPVLAKLDYFDGTCSNLPQGVVNQEGVYTVAGVIAFYNENTEGQQVEITYQKSDRLDESLFVLPTEIPTVTPTPEPTATIVTIATSEPSPAPPAVRASPEQEATPVASPAPSVRATP